MRRTDEFSGANDDFLAAEMNRNFLSMKKIKSTKSVFVVISVVLMAMQLCFTVIGGINVFMLSGLIINAVTLGFCIRKAPKTFGLYILAVFNVLLVFMYIIYVFSNKMYIDYFIAITGHLFLAVEAFVAARLKELDFELSSKPGYPYFTELAKLEAERKEYVPENNMRSCRKSENTVMDEVSLSPEFPDQNTRVKLEKKETYEMDGVSLADVPERYYADSFINEEKLQAERKE